MESEEGLELRLQGLQKQLGKKQEFEEAVSSIKSVLQQRYPSASPPLRRSVGTWFFPMLFSAAGTPFSRSRIDSAKLQSKSMIVAFCAFKVSVLVLDCGVLVNRIIDIGLGFF